LRCNSSGSVASFPASGIAGLQKTYEANFGEVPSGDITKIRADKVPEHDILCAGFPCQAFTLAGQRRGFEDTRGTLFFDIARTLKAKRPAVFFLENLKGLMSHRVGQTLAAILCVLRDELGYFVPTPQVIKAEDHGVPQKRGHVLPVGLHSDLNINRFNYTCPSKV
jgi:DNA (cytosine-5)-methyltransferase 1